MKRFYLILLTALAMASPLHAQTTDSPKVTGTVVDSQGNAVTGATIECYQYPSMMRFGPAELVLKEHATTDAQGAFELLAIDGYATIVIKKDGMAPTWRSWYAVPATPQKIAMPAASSLAGTVIDDIGQPVGDAEVSIVSALNKAANDMNQPNFVFANVAQGLFSTRTAADGKFKIDNFPADAQALFLVKKTGKALRPLDHKNQFENLPYHAGQDDITLTADPSGSISGTVVSRDSGQPIAGAVLRLQPAAQNIGFFLTDAIRIQSGSDGTFTIPDVASGDYKVTASFTNEPVADWTAEAVPATVTVGQSVSNIQIRAIKGGVVEVTVRNKSNHESITNVVVSVYGQEMGGQAGSTDNNGVARFRLTAGQYWVSAIKPDMSQVQSQAIVTDGQTLKLTLELPPADKVTGIVRDASGQPVAGAAVWIVPSYNGNDRGTTTDADGHFSVAWHKASWDNASEQQYCIVAQHVARNLAGTQNIAGTNVNVTMNPAMKVSGLVKDPAGHPVTNVVAYLSIHFDNWSSTVSRTPAHSDDQGRMIVETLPQGQRYGWYLSASGYGSAHQEMDTADPKADHYDFPPIVMKVADRKLSGRVLGTNGAPVAGVQVYLNGEGQPNGAVVTDADGRFTFDAVCEGPVSLNANTKGFFGNTRAMGGDTNAVIRFNAQARSYAAQASQTLTGTVLDSAGNPAVGATVIVSPGWGRADTGKVDDKGEFSLGWEPQQGMRNTRYYAIARDLSHNTAVMEEISTNKNRVSLRLQPALSISGTIQDANGAPVTKANVNLNIMLGNNGGLVGHQPIKVDADGKFTIPALPTGQAYHVYISANGYGSAQKNVGKLRSQTNGIELPPFRLKTANLILAGQVLDAAGKPLPGADVNFNGTGQQNGNATADAEGRFRFKVCNGPIQVYSWNQGGNGGRNNYGYSWARGGDTNVVVKMGVQQQQPRQAVVREVPLKSQAWTLSSLVTWPLNHKFAAAGLVLFQLLLLAGTAAGIFLATRRKS